MNSRLVYFGLVSQRSHRAQLQLSEDVDMDGSVRSGLLQSCNKYSYFTVFTSNCVRVGRVSREEDTVQSLCKAIMY